MRGTLVLPVLACALGLACAAADGVQFMPRAPQSAEAVSLLGDTLWTVPIPVELGQRLVEDLHDARGESAAHPASVAYQLAVARRTAALGRFREALDLYTRAAQRHFDDPRPLRYRGELLLYLRRFRLASTDLDRAARALDWTDGADLLEIPEHSAAPGGSLAFGIRFHQGVARYLLGQLPEAQAALQASLGQASDAQEFSRGVLWLWLSLVRQHRDGEAAEALAYAGRVLGPGGLAREYRMLQTLADPAGADSMRRSLGARPRDDAEALAGYALAIRAGDAAPDGPRLLAWVRSAPNWASLPVVAAEADLARLRNDRPAGETGA